MSSGMPFNELELASLTPCPAGQIRMWPGSPCVPMPAGNQPLFGPGGSAASAAGSAIGTNLQQYGWDLLFGVGAVGMILLGVWMMAGKPEPKAIPVPV